MSLALTLARHVGDGREAIGLLTNQAHGPEHVPAIALVLFRHCWLRWSRASIWSMLCNSSRIILFYILSGDSGPRNAIDYRVLAHCVKQLPKAS